jgi:hypothetical protein
MEDHAQLIEDCEDRESWLTDRDRRFLDSLRRQMESGKSLSEKQSEKLEEVWERATARG